jgi:hypothetical protein
MSARRHAEWVCDCTVLGGTGPGVHGAVLSFHFACGTQRDLFSSVGFLSASSRVGYSMNELLLLCTSTVLWNYLE